MPASGLAQGRAAHGGDAPPPMNHTINVRRFAPQRLIKVKLQACRLLHVSGAKRLNRDDQLLVQAAVVGLFAYLRRSDAVGQPFREFVPPKVQGEGLERAQHRPEQVA